MRVKGGLRSFFARMVPDPVLFALAMLATLVGLLFIFDAGYARSLTDGKGWMPKEFRSQLIWLVPSLILTLVATTLKPTFWRRAAPILWGIMMVLLVIVAKFGTSNSGAKRWINIAGQEFQPAEFAKIFVILFLAACFADRKAWPQKISRRSFVRWLETVGPAKFKRMMPGFSLLIVFVMIAEEPDLGTAAVVAAVGMVLFVVGGVSKKSLIAASLLALVGAGVMVAREPYRLERITKHVNRWDGENADDIGFQTVQSEAAMAEGGLIGVGFGNGRAKHVMPATTTDFILATIGEETGLLGVVGIIGLLGAIVARLIFLGQRQKDAFGALILFGTASWIGIQTCVNIMMANGFLPAIGIPLPFISSGGSSLISLWVCIGVCQCVVKKREVRVKAVSSASANDGIEDEQDNANDRDRWGNRRPHLSRA